jgi:hypothetical protein
MLLTCKQIAAMDREDNKCHFVRRYNYDYDIKRHTKRLEISPIGYEYGNYYDGRDKPPGWGITNPGLPNGWLHSVNDLPCYGENIRDKHNCNIGYWYKNGKKHRMYNPAVYGEMEGVLFTA